jgi:hypothetical protein
MTTLHASPANVKWRNIGIMQTFLPVPSLTRSAQILDDKRLGRQRQEALTILQILTGYRDGGGYANHPCTRQWSKSVYGLALYTLAMCREWQRRGFKDTTEPKVFEAFTSDVSLRLYDSKDWNIARLKRHALLPWWFGWKTYHENQRCVLLYKDYQFYKPKLDPDGTHDKSLLHTTPNIWPHPILHTYRLTCPSREPLVPMRANMHFRDPLNPYRGLCGAGYDYPNAVRKTEIASQITCSDCRAIIEQML